MANKRPGIFYGYVIVIAAFLILLIQYGALYTFGVFLKPLIADFGWSRGATSAAYSLAMFMHGVGNFMAGRLNDRFGPKPVVVVGGFLLGLGFLLLSRMDSLWQFYLLYSVMVGLGLSGGFAPLSSTVARWFVKRRGLMTGIVVSGMGAGAVLMPPVAEQLIASQGWRNSYIIVGTIALLASIIIAQFLRRDPATMGLSAYGEDKANGITAPDLMTQGYSLGAALRTRQFWILSIIYIIHGILVQATIVHIVPYATDLGVPPLTAANILAIVGGLSIVGRIGLGSASDKIGDRITLIITLALLTFALFWLQRADQLWMLFLFAAVFGFAYGGQVSLTSPLMARLFGMKSHGVILGALILGITIGGAIGHLLAGKLFDITGGYDLPFLIWAFLAVAGLLLSMMLKRSKNSTQQGRKGYYS